MPTAFIHTHTHIHSGSCIHQQRCNPRNGAARQSLASLQEAVERSADTSLFGEGGGRRWISSLTVTILCLRQLSWLKCFCTAFDAAIFMAGQGGLMTELLHAGDFQLYNLEQYF
jgi:hypothetical protein